MVSLARAFGAVGQAVRFGVAPKTGQARIKVMGEGQRRSRDAERSRFPSLWPQVRQLMDDGAVQILVELDDAGAGDEELEQATARVQKDLLQLRVDSVKRPSAGPAPAGTRAGELMAIGALLVTAQQGWQLLAGVVEQVRSWASRGEGRSVTVSIDGDSIVLTGTSDENERLLIEGWLERKRGDAQRGGQT